MMSNNDAQIVERLNTVLKPVLDVEHDDHIHDGAYTCSQMHTTVNHAMADIDDNDALYDALVECWRMQATLVSTGNQFALISYAVQSVAAAIHGTAQAHGRTSDVEELMHAVSPLMLLCSRLADKFSPE